RCIQRVLPPTDDRADRAGRRRRASCRGAGDRGRYARIGGIVVEFRDVAGMVLDLGISYGISRVGVGKGLPKEFAADIVGSGVGGGVGAAVSSGANINSITEGVLAGAGFGALGSAAGYGEIGRASCREGGWHW